MSDASEEVAKREQLHAFTQGKAAKQGSSPPKPLADPERNLAATQAEEEVSVCYSATVLLLSPPLSPPPSPPTLAPTFPPILARILAATLASAFTSALTSTPRRVASYGR